MIDTETLVSLYRATEIDSITGKPAWSGFILLDGTPEADPPYFLCRNEDQAALQYAILDRAYRWRGAGARLSMPQDGGSLPLPEGRCILLDAIDLEGRVSIMARIMNLQPSTEKEDVGERSEQ